MKYIITDKGEVAIGINTYHQIIAEQTKVQGRVIAAGHCKQNEDGSYSVWGASIGYGIQSKPADAYTLEHTKEKLFFQENYGV